MIDLAQSIKLQLLAINPSLRIFLDVDDLGEVHKLEVTNLGVTNK